MAKPRILVVDDEKNICEFLSIFFKKEGYEVQTTESPKNALKIVEDWNPSVVVIDIRMPEIDGLSLLSKIKEKKSSIIPIIITAYASVESAVEAMKRGAFDYITKPFKLEEIKLVINRAIETQKLKEENIKLQEEIKKLKISDEIIGKSKKFQQVLEIVKKVADTDSTVLIYGESGTGKELIAREIHKLSKRNKNPFIAVNCGALPETLLESELFGYKKGAFTGANKNKDGLFLAADKGTLFLDEIASASPKIQVSILRAIEQKEITPIGETKSISVDVRVIAATNQNLEELVKKEKFREDLYYRLNVVPIHIPPLRERKEDIPLLIFHLLKKYSKKYKIKEKKIANEAMELLINYEWPGNVRELENFIEREIILGDSPIIKIEDLPDKIKESAIGLTSITKKELGEKNLTTRQQKVIDYLKEHKKITTKICAEMFNISQRMVRNELKKLIDKNIILQKGVSKKNTYYILREINGN